MTRFLKVSSILLVVLAFTHCSDRGGRRIGGQSYYSQTPAHTQSGYYFSAVPNTYNLTFQPAPPVIPPEIIPVDEKKTVIDEAPDWTTICANALAEVKDPTDELKASFSQDFDNDRLSDGCEYVLKSFYPDSLEYAALDPYVYNGAIVGGRYFYDDNQKLDLSTEEEDAWLKDKKDLGGMGFGTITTKSKRVIQKFSVLKKRLDPDIFAYKSLYYTFSDEPMRIDERFAASVRSPGNFQNVPDDIYMALLQGDGDEAFPFTASSVANPAVKNVGDSVYYLTGFGKDTDSIRSRDAAMVVDEFHIGFPDNVDEIQIAVGALSNQNNEEISQSRSGIYYVLNDGESILLQNGLLADQGKRLEGTKFGTIHRSIASCKTAHITVIYFTNYPKGTQRTPLFVENVFYRLNAEQPWKNITQGMISIQPQGGVGCHEKFNGRDPGHAKMFFKNTKAVTSRVAGVVDFNTSLNAGRSFDPAYAICRNCNDSGSLSSILGEALDTIPNMDRVTISEFEKSFSQIDPSVLPEDEQKLFNDVVTALNTTNGLLDPSNPDNPQNKELADLQTSLNGLSPGSSDFATTAADLQQQIDALRANPNMTQDQQDQLNALEATLKDLSQQDATKQQEAARASDSAVYLVPAGTAGAIALPLAKMQELAKQGVIFKDENGNVYDPLTEPDPNTVKNIKPEEMDKILAQLGTKLGTASPAEKAEIAKLLTDLKSIPGVDGAKIDKFITDNQAGLKGTSLVPDEGKEIVLDPAGEVQLTVPDMQKLARLGFTFTENGNPYNPLAEPKDSKVIKNTTPTEIDGVITALEDQLKNKNPDLTTAQKADLSELLDDLKDNPGIDPAQIDQFKQAHASDLRLMWEPQQLKLFDDWEKDLKLNPQFGTSLDNWKQGFSTPDAERSARADALKRINDKLLDPTSLPTFPVDDRIPYAEALKNSGFITPDEHLALRLNLEKLRNLSDNSGFVFKSVFVDVGGVSVPAIALEGETINFKSGSNQIDDVSQKLLRRVAKDIALYKKLKNTAVYVLLKAYTDPEGTDENNRKLSECRANSVKSYFAGDLEIQSCNGKGVATNVPFTVIPDAQLLADQKIDRALITAIGLGEDKSKGQKVSKAVAAKLRRVEIYLSDKPFPAVPQK